MALSDFDVQFVDRCYGKNYVRLLHVRKEGIRHYVKELEVSTALTLNDTKDYLKGDNSSIVATDSQKNTVYILAKKHGIDSIEKFATILSEHFLKKYDHVIRARVYIEENPWQRIEQDGIPHNHAFLATGGMVRTCLLLQDKHGRPRLTCGLKDMKVMKTTKSAFKNFIRDEFRTLPDADDRVFTTVIDAQWDYDTHTALNYDETWECAKKCILEVFAGPPVTGVQSPSVQKTLYDTVKLILQRIPKVTKVSIELPNVHAYEFDLKKFPALGFDKNGEVFQPTAKPSGNIKATIQRRVSAKL